MDLVPSIDEHTEGDRKLHYDITITDDSIQIDFDPEKYCNCWRYDPNDDWSMCLICLKPIHEDFK